MVYRHLVNSYVHALTRSLDFDCVEEVERDSKKFIFKIKQSPYVLFFGV